MIVVVSLLLLEEMDVSNVRRLGWMFKLLFAMSIVSNVIKLLEDTGLPNLKSAMELMEFPIIDTLIRFIISK